MSFFSLEFVSYFILAFSLYWIITPFPRLQNCVLLAFSYFFVASFSPPSAMILAVWSLAIFTLAHSAARWLSLRVTAAVLITMVATIFGCFKYYPALREGLQQQLAEWQLAVDLPVLNVLMPLGLSFYVFNSVSYVVSAQRKACPPGRFLDVMLYLSFFATLIAGPINRATQLLPQIASRAPRAMLDLNRAILLIALALAKLFFFSAWLNDSWVQSAFSNPQSASSGQALLAVYAWAWEIYFNFSGYTNLVTGIALLLGFRVATNFNHPYLATNPGDFWQRWHISLSRFIRDYVYIPLGGNRSSLATTQRNVMIAMVLSGVWHGAGLTFLVWGVIHGLGAVCHNLWRRVVPASARPAPFATLLARIVMFHFVCLAWIFFRASDLNGALMMIQQIVTPDGSLLQPEIVLPLAGFWLVLLTYPQLVALRGRLADALRQLSWYLVPVPVTLLLAGVFFFAPAGVPEFIYANF